MSSFAQFSILIYNKLCFENGCCQGNNQRGALGNGLSEAVNYITF